MLDHGDIMASEQRKARLLAERRERKPSLMTAMRVNQMEMLERVEGLANMVSELTSAVSELKADQGLILTALQATAKMAGSVKGAA